MAEPADLRTVVRGHAELAPDATALILVDEGDRVVTRGGLDEQVTATAHGLAARALPGERVLILLEPGLDYVVTFLACLYAGLVAVPQYPPRGARDLAALGRTAADARVAVTVLSGAVHTLLSGHEPGFAGGAATWCTPSVLTGPATADGLPRLRGDDLALLQYTSGSTGVPKGVMVRHANLVHNSLVIRRALGADAESVGVSWLPPYHDMGLIGGLLQPLSTGFVGVLLSPMTFLRRPAAWLQAVTRFGGTLSAAPDFAYRECVRRIDDRTRENLDLRTWRHALTGAEPVRASTIEDFSAAFTDAGFTRRAFRPCYGLAEATLMVTCEDADRAPLTRTVDRRSLADGRVVDTAADAGAVLVAAGAPVGPDLVVVTDAEGRPVGVDTVGEVLVGGPTVAAGYWNRPDDGAFQATVPGLPGPFLRTGDLGVLDADGRVFVTGRAKDLLIVRGRNVHPEDVEATAEAAHPAVRPSGCAVFGLPDDIDGERVVVVCEVTGAATTGPDVVTAVARAVSTVHGLARPAVVVVTRGRIPRTTSGKIRRSACRDLLLSGDLGVVTTTPAADPAGPVDDSDLQGLVAVAARVGRDEVDPDLPLVASGVDSLAAVRLAAALQATHDGVPDPVELLDGMSVADLRRRLRPRPPGTPVGPGVTAPGPDTPPAPPTRIQESLWLLDRAGAGAAYVVPGLVQLHGPVGPDQLARAFDDVVARHPFLRTRLWPDRQGRLTVSHDAPPPTLTTLGPAATLEAATARAAAAASERFGSPGDGPLLRAVVVPGPPGVLVVGVGVHHVLADGWTLALLVDEWGATLADHLAGRPVGTRPALQVAPEPAPTAGATDHWRQVLHGAAAVTLPPDHHPPAAPTWDGGAVEVHVPAAVMRPVRAFAARHGASTHAAVLAAFAATLSRWTDQYDVVVGVPSGRRTAATAAGTGVLVNTLPVRLDLTDDPRWSTITERAAAATRAARRHEDLDVERIAEVAGHLDPRSGRAPLLRVCLAWQELPTTAWPVPGVRVETRVLPPPGAQFEVTMSLVPDADGGLTGHVVYATDLFDTASIRALVAAFVAVLRGGPGEDPRLADLALPPAGPDAPAGSDVPAGPDVLDRAGRAVAVGVVGHLAGPTGPRLVRRGADGVVTDLGALADAVVVRGTRVTPERLAAVLERSPAVRSASVRLVPGDGDDAGPTLVATVEPAGDTLDRHALVAFAAGILPATVVPDRIDLAALTTGDASTGGFELVSLSPAAATPARAPADGLETRLAQLWAEVLERSDIGADVSFLDLGGHSLHAARLAARVEATTGVRFAVGDVLSHRATVAWMAAGVAAHDGPTDDDTEALVEQLAGMSDEELDRLLDDEEDDPDGHPGS